METGQPFMRTCDRRLIALCGGLLLLLLSACTVPVEAEPAQPTPGITASPTPSPTATWTPTPSPTFTPGPTATPYPTLALLLLTPTLTPTATPPPTRTPLPSPTPTPLVWSLPEAVAPQPFGVEIHFTRPNEGELGQLAAAGFSYVRMDLFWSEVERRPGEYDFTAYDGLLAALTAHGLRAIFILDYGNPLYDGGHSPYTDEGRAAFARFAATAAARYRGRGILWEIWNEPNLAQFWYPTPNATTYGRLALTTAAAIRRADPAALIVAPALVSFEWNYWHTLGQMGVFERLDAVSVHPYGLAAPEQALPRYRELRALLDRYSPDWTVPLIASEWGYSSVAGGISEETQAHYLVRTWLFNLAHDVVMTTWYDWRNDGVDPAELEQNFGVVANDYTPKPAYRAARALSETLGGYRFWRRLALGEPDDYVLLFQRADELALAAWSVTRTHEITLPLAIVQEVAWNGARRTLLGAAGVLSVTLDAAPRYLLLPDATPEVLRLGGWGPAYTFNPIWRDAENSLLLTFENRFAQPVHAEVQVWVAGELRGTQTIAISPESLTNARVAVDGVGLWKDVPAELRFITPDAVLLPLQSARIWLLPRERK